jgi:repressor LexA
MLYELKEARKRKGYSQADAAKALDVPLGTYRNWEQCISMPRDNAMLKRIADMLSVSMEALFGYDVMPPGGFSDLPEQQESKLKYVPAYGEIAAGEPIYMYEVDRHLPVPMEVMNDRPRSYLVKVVGNSMNRRIPNGYYALVDPDDSELNEHDAFAICVNGDHATIKRVKKLENGYELIPDSYDQTCLPIVLDYNDPADKDKMVTVLGKVVYAVMPFDYEI